MMTSQKAIDGSGLLTKVEFEEACKAMELLKWENHQAGVTLTSRKEVSYGISILAQ